MTETPHDSDVTFIKALAELLRANDLTELRVKREFGEDDSLDVKVSRGHIAVAPPAPPAAPAATPETPQTPGTRVAEAQDDPSRQPGAVTSPMVGTVYMAPEPGASAFVSPGTTVKEGQTLLIIEAMKTMNHIPSPRAGVVKRILIEDGSPVEFGAPLMIIE